MASQLLSLFDHVPDRRRAEGKRYPLGPVLLYSVLAMLAGARSYRQISIFITTHLACLNAAFGTPLRRAPAYSSLWLILNGVNGDDLEAAFRLHAEGLDALTAGTVRAIAVDGKTLRRSFDSFADRKAMHLLGAFAHDGHIILGHLAIEEKSNEIPAVQKLIPALGLTGRLYTMDAMHCQKNL